MTKRQQTDKRQFRHNTFDRRRSIWRDVLETSFMRSRFLCLRFVSRIGSTLLLAIALNVAIAATPIVSAVQASEAQPTTLPLRVVWEPCQAQDGVAAGLQCAKVRAPLRWQKPDGRKITLSVRRYRARGRSRGQLWLLDGGPGGDGLSFLAPDVLPIFARFGYDVYVPSHRGTGGSTGLRCQAGVGHIRACGRDLLAQWGSDLRGFRSWQAGRDVGELIRATQAPNQKVAIYGVSYGTYWLQRYLQSFPNQADMLILDGVLDLRAPVWRNSQLANRVGLRLLDMCGADRVCNTALGSSPKESLRKAFSNFVGRRCLRDFDPTQIGFDDDMDRHAVLAETFGTIMSEFTAERVLIPGLIRRLARCNRQDERELMHFYDVASRLLECDEHERDCQSGESLESSEALGLVVEALDLLGWKTRYTTKADADRLLFFGDNETRERLRLSRLFPRFRVRRDHTIQANSAVPMLILQGELDTATISTWGERVARHFSGEHQHYVSFPQGGHGLFGQTQLVDGSYCSRRLIQQFLDDPMSTLDRSCVDDVVPLDFSGNDAATTEIAKFFLGTPDLY